MTTKIDFEFISELEGGRRTRGYVPAPSVSKSGVTIATGFDLGQRNEFDLRSLRIGLLLSAKLKPHLGLKGADAQAALKEKPLVISWHEAEEIDKAVKAAHVLELQLKYNSAPEIGKKFGELPPQAQTVITSISFQYGVRLDTRTPRFWKAVTSQDWLEAAKILKDFGDAYPSRRRKEAALLEKIK